MNRLQIFLPFLIIGNKFLDYLLFYIINKIKVIEFNFIVYIVFMYLLYI
jgi:hypothetical protein